MSLIIQKANYVKIIQLKIREVLDNLASELNYSNLSFSFNFLKKNKAYTRDVF